MTGAPSLRFGRNEKEIYGAESATTSNQMEFMAAVWALESRTRPSTVHLHADGQYLGQGITEWRSAGSATAG